LKNGFKKNQNNEDISLNCGVSLIRWEKYQDVEDVYKKILKRQKVF